MVGQQSLDLLIGVRIPVSQPTQSVCSWQFAVGGLNQMITAANRQVPTANEQ